MRCVQRGQIKKQFERCMSNVVKVKSSLKPTVKHEKLMLLHPVQQRCASRALLSLCVEEAWQDVAGIAEHNLHVNVCCGLEDGRHVAARTPQVCTNL
jgi:hypothetical protein